MMKRIPTKGSFFPGQSRFLLAAVSRSWTTFCDGMWTRCGPKRRFVQRAWPDSELVESWETEGRIEASGFDIGGGSCSRPSLSDRRWIWFSDGTAGGECESWSDCILVRYSGENGAVGMGIALAAGVAAALSVALMIRLLLLGDDPKHLSSDGFRGDHG